MALRGAQGDHPTEGREAPEAEAVQPSRTGSGGKANGIVLWRELLGTEGIDGRWKAQRGDPGGVQRGPRRGGSP